MAAKFVDITGQKYGRLTVLEFVGIEPKHKNRIWKCVCDCGQFKEVIRIALTRGQTKSCGCLEIENRNRYKTNFNVRYSTAISPGEASFNHVYRDYIKNAKFRKLSFDLDKDAFRKITQQNCFYCGLPPSNTAINEYNGNFIYSGVDRINNSIGYNMGNVVPCCKECNFAKRETDSETFIEWLKRAGEYALQNH